MSTASGDAVIPLAVHQDREQMAVQFIHGVILVANLRRLIQILGQHSVPGPVTQFDCDPAHFGEVTDNFFG